MIFVLLYLQFFMHSLVLIFNQHDYLVRLSLILFPVAENVECKMRSTFVTCAKVLCFNIEKNTNENARDLKKRKLNFLLNKNFNSAKNMWIFKFHISIYFKLRKALIRGLSMVQWPIITFFVFMNQKIKYKCCIINFTSKFF